MNPWPLTTLRRTQFALVSIAALVMLSLSICIPLAGCTASHVDTEAAPTAPAGSPAHASALPANLAAPHVELGLRDFFKALAAAYARENIDFTQPQLPALWLYRPDGRLQSTYTSGPAAAQRAQRFIARNDAIDMDAATRASTDASANTDLGTPTWPLLARTLVNEGAAKIEVYPDAASGRWVAVLLLPPEPMCTASCPSLRDEVARMHAARPRELQRLDIQLTL